MITNKQNSFPKAKFGSRIIGALSDFRNTDSGARTSDFDFKNELKNGKQFVTNIDRSILSPYQQTKA